MKSLPSRYIIPIRILIFIILETVCIIFISDNSIIQRYLILEKVRNAQSVFWKQNQKIKEFFNLRKQNEDLAFRNFFLLRENMKHHELVDIKNSEAYLHTFKTMDSIKRAKDTLAIDKQRFSYIGARVVKNSIGSLHNYIIIDKGRADGVEENMGVITASGIIGIIRAVGEHNSFVLSFLNNKQQVSAKIGHTDAFGPLRWDKKNIMEATLHEIPQHINVTNGDTVFTSGLSSFYPSDIPIGRVMSSKVINGVHLAVKVRLFQDAANLAYVIVAKNNNRQEIDSLSNFPFSKYE